MTLFAFSCAELRYAPRMEMVEVATEPAVVARPTQPTRWKPVSRSYERFASSHWRGLIIGGTIASLIGVGLIIGGVVGLQRQEAANAEANAQCRAQQDWLCGVFDGFTYLPYESMVGVGSAAAATGVVLLGVGASRFDRERAQRW